jgi:hypothetical protein
MAACDQAALAATSELVLGLHAGAAAIRERAAPWRGRPAFLSASQLLALRAEARAARQDAVLDGAHFVAKASARAFEFGGSPDLLRLVAAGIGPVAFTGVVSFLYYDEPGQGIPPHIDAEQTSINVIMMLDHSVPSGELGSALVLHPPGKTHERILLGAGEMVVFHAGAITHEREAVGKDEKISLLSFGFRPAAQA